MMKFREMSFWHKLSIAAAARDTPGYYVLKFGTGNTGNDMFFMVNEVFLQYLAWSDAQLIAAGLPANHVQSLSHYVITGNNPSVPEPSTLILLGSGLVVLATTARRFLAFVNR
jgi:PEP-CTERM motif